MEKKHINGKKVNTMISDQYEIYHVKDIVSQNKTVYHHHDFYEIHATLEGEAIFYLDGRQFTIQSGNVLLIHSRDLHRIVRQSTDVFERVYMFITPAFLESRSTKWSNLSACFWPIGERRSRILHIEPQVLKEKLSFIDQTLDRKDYGADIRYEQALVEYLIFLNRMVQIEEHISEENFTVPNERLEKMLQFVAKNLSEPLSLKQMEKEFFISKYHVTREFKKYTGFTFHQYVMKKKLLYSKQLLREYGSSSSIYSKCGFASYPHYLRAFKTEFGVTPKEFLKKDLAGEFVHYTHYEEENKDLF